MRKQNYQDKDPSTPLWVLRKHVTMFQQMHIITQKVSNKYIHNIRKEAIFLSLVGMSETFEIVVITSFLWLHFPFKTLGTFFSSGAQVVGDIEIMSCIWSSFPERSVWPQKTERTDFHTYELSHHNYPLMSCCSFSYSAVCSSKYFQPLSDDKLLVRLMDQKWRDEGRKPKKRGGMVKQRKNG